MSAISSSSRPAAWWGVLTGLVVLGLLAAFAIGLPKAHQDGEPSALRLTLPDQLPGGYLASDDPRAFAGGQLEDQADAIVEREKSSADYGNEVLPAVLGRAAATRTYVTNGTEAIFVQAFQSEGGAFAPNSLPDPKSTGGQSAIEMRNVGDGVCILTHESTQAATQTSGPRSAYSQCQVTHGGVTVQIASDAIEAEQLVDVADELLADLPQV